jgi:hypothetical protein
LHLQVQHGVVHGDVDALAATVVLNLVWAVAIGIALAGFLALRRISQATGVEREPIEPHDHHDEEAALHTALADTRLWHGGPGSLVLVLDRLAGLAGVLDGGGPRVLDDLDGRLRTVVVHDLLAHTRYPEPRVHEDVYDRLARSVHHVYLRSQRERGVAWASTPAMRRWEDLSDDLRESNRGWVVGLPDRLARVGGTIAPRDGDNGTEIPAGMLDRLARAEHDLWEAVRVELGWRYGPVRDDARRLHPLIGVAWEDVPEIEKEKDRDVIRNLPQILAEFGLELVFYARSAPAEARRGAG